MYSNYYYQLHYLGFLIVFLLPTLQECLSIENKHKNIIVAESGDSITLTWEFSGDDYNGVFIQIYHNKKVYDHLIATNLVNGPTSTGLYILTRSLVPLVNRISGTIKSNGYNGTCEMTIHGVQFEDAGTMIMKVLGAATSDTVFKSTTLFVRGKCKNASIPIIPHVHRTSIGEEISVSLTLCGNPRPNVKWYIGESIMNGTVAKSTHEHYQYTYSFNVRVTSEMCGKNISYLVDAENTFQNESTSLSKIFVENFPITRWELSGTDSVPCLTWQVADDYFGLCEVDLFFSFLKNANTTLSVFIPLTKDYTQYCPITSDFMDVSYKTITYVRNEDNVKIQVSQINQTLARVPLTRTTPTSTKTSSTSLNTQRFKIHREQIKETIEILKVTGVFIAGFIVGLMFTIIISVLRKKRIQRKNRKDENWQKNIEFQCVRENYAALTLPASTVTSNYTELQNSYEQMEKKATGKTSMRADPTYEIMSRDSRPWSGQENSLPSCVSSKPSSSCGRLGRVYNDYE